MVNHSICSVAIAGRKVSRMNDEGIFLITDDQAEQKSVVDVRQVDGSSSSRLYLQ